MIYLLPLEEFEEDVFDSDGFLVDVESSEGGVHLFLALD